jgi:hypothetical protein
VADASDMITLSADPWRVGRRTVTHRVVMRFQELANAVVGYVCGCGKRELTDGIVGSMCQRLNLLVFLTEMRIREENYPIS